MSAPEIGQRAGTVGKTALKPPLERKKYRYPKSQPTTAVSEGVVQTFPN